MADSVRDTAQQAIYERIAEVAKNADAETLEKLGKAYSHTAHGPHGGDYDAEQRNTNDNENRTEYHYIQHQGEDAKRPHTGFGPGEDEG